jgi:hypothetical protein
MSGLAAGEPLPPFLQACVRRQHPSSASTPPAQGSERWAGCRSSVEATKKLPSRKGQLVCTCRYTRRVATRSGTCSKGTCSGEKQYKGTP